MNTNSNVYTVVYSLVVVAIVAAVLAFVSDTLKPLQEANEKAETISQILSAAQIEYTEGDNAAIIDTYKENIAEAYLVDSLGAKSGELSIEDAEVYSTSKLKAQNYVITGKSDDSLCLPVYLFKNGTKVIPIYGAGLWGPVWGYIAVTPDGTMAGAYFDHASETPGLGGKIKDDPAFRAQFAGKVFIFEAAEPFEIVKGGAKGQANGIDAISGATMTSKGLQAAINTWAKAYAGIIGAAAPAAPEHECCGSCAGCGNMENGACCGMCEDQADAVSGATECCDSLAAADTIKVEE